MDEEISLSRRRLLQRLAVGASVAPLAASALRPSFAASAPLLSVTAPEAKAVKYVEDAKDAQGATPGSNCGNCALYQGAANSAQGPCPLYQNKQVLSKAWCSAWVKKP